MPSAHTAEWQPIRSITSRLAPRQKFDFKLAVIWVRMRVIYFTLAHFGRWCNKKGISMRGGELRSSRRMGRGKLWHHRFLPRLVLTIKKEPYFGSINLFYGWNVTIIWRDCNKAMEILRRLFDKLREVIAGPLVSAWMYNHLRASAGNRVRLMLFLRSCFGRPNTLL